MKKFFLSCTVLGMSIAAFAQPQAKKVADVAKFTTETIEFGKIKQSVPAKGTFVVTNISNAPLIIEQANPTCGCTISDYTKEPIAPGKTGVINATYNAASPGHFEKHLTVKFAGIDEMKSITFVGDVIPAEEFEKTKGNSTQEVKATPVVAAPAVEVVPAPKTQKSAVKKTAAKKPTVKKAATATNSQAK